MTILGTLVLILLMPRFSRLADVRQKTEKRKALHLGEQKLRSGYPVCEQENGIYLSEPNCMHEHNAV